MDGGSTAGSTHGWENELLDAVFQHEHDAGHLVADALAFRERDVPQGVRLVCFRHAADEFGKAVGLLGLLADESRLPAGEQLPDDAEVDTLLTEFRGWYRDPTPEPGDDGDTDGLTPAEVAHGNQAGRDAAELVRSHIAHDPGRAEALLDRCDTRIVAHQLARLLASIINADDAGLKAVAEQPAVVLAAWENSFRDPPA